MGNRTYVRQIEMKVGDNTARMLYEVQYIKKLETDIAVAIGGVVMESMKTK